VSAALRYSSEENAASTVLGVESSARAYRWVERLHPGRALISTAIAQANGLPELLGRILAARGADSQTAAAHLDPSLRSLLPDPSTLQDMEAAAARFARAIESEERVAVFGDYDVDGAASVALVERYMRAHGQGVSTYIPDRLTEGYGPSETVLTDLAKAGASLILTVDCGTTAPEAIAAGRNAGADVLVIDHHQADEALPDATALVNPNRLDDLSGQGHLAAAGLVFLFLVETTRVLRRNGFYRGRPEPDLLGLLDLVALATVCDVVPFKGVNRAFVAKGLAVLRMRNNAGLRALADAARIDSAPSCYTLGFILGPRINAGGRVGASALGAKLLACDDDVEARSIAAKLELLNAERRAIEEAMLDEAIGGAERLLEADPDRPVILLGAEGWHKGLLGLVSSRITERFERPSLVVAWDKDGTGTGSARSIASVDLGAAIRGALQAGLLLKGGGHAMAAGFKLARTQEEPFVAFLHARLSAHIASARLVRDLKLDGAMSASGATADLLKLLERAGPYGPGHPEPRFAFPAHRVSRVRLMKQAHLRCTLSSSDGGRIDACAFRVAETPLGRLILDSEGLPLHVAGRLRPTHWNGRAGVELLIDDAAAMQPT